MLSEKQRKTIEQTSAYGQALVRSPLRAGESEAEEVEVRSRRSSRFEETFDRECRVNHADVGVRLRKISPHRTGSGVDVLGE